jgi:predicted metallo-beta-lactamase superfamily hydrolase
MRITFLGTESLGVRGMCCLVEISNRSILIDPGVALGFLRKGLHPHPCQVAVCAGVRDRILSVLGHATDIVISHYHGDHLPLAHPTPYQIPLEAVPHLSGIRFWCKGTEGLSSQSVQRHDDFEEYIGTTLPDAEGLNDGTIHCSHPVPHGPRSSPFGSVMMTRIVDDHTVFIHASDIQLLDDETIATIFGWHPTILFVSGPAIYLSQLSHEDRKNAWNNAMFLGESVPVMIVDHHLLRSEEGWKWLLQLKKASPNRVLCAAEFMGKKPLLLEARREELYSRMPVPFGWHERYSRGEIGTEGYEQVPF